MNQHLLNQAYLLTAQSFPVFFKKYNNLQKYRSDVIALYKKRNYNTIWHDTEGLIEFANLLYAKVNLLEEEGLKFYLAYKDKIDSIFSDESAGN